MTPEELKFAMRKAFKTVPPPRIYQQPPQKDGISHCSSCDGLRDFTNKTWLDVGSDTIDRNFDILPLFSTEEFHHFLPAFLLRAIDTEGSMVWEFTFYALTGKPRDWFTDRIQPFSQEQIQCIIDYLHLMQAQFEEREHWLLTDKVMAKRFQFWNEQLGQRQALR